MGHASFPFTRDTYTSMKALRVHNMAAFGHVPAAKYAGDQKVYSQPAWRMDIGGSLLI
jgi:hypothetical protein